MTDLEKKMLMFHIEQIEKRNRIISNAEETAKKSYEEEYTDQPKYPVMMGIMCGLCMTNTAIISTQVEELKKLIEKM